MFDALPGNVGANGGSPDHGLPNAVSPDSSTPPSSVESVLLQRKNIRLQGYDYTAVGVYFITICSHDKKHIFGHMREGVMHLNVFGEIVAEEWQRSGEIRKEVAVEEFVVMPNHLHGIVIIYDTTVSIVEDARSVSLITGDPPIAPTTTTTLKPRSLGALIAGFKQAVTLRMRTAGFAGQVWQRGYYDHIIRNDHDYNATQAYIVNNPVNWNKGGSEGL